ncbi:MAG TPA: hypothetical protein VK212_06505 [Lentimicrobium sp.]|nr:hypothetical protein [Lentimicrobium sp.]
MKKDLLFGLLIVAIFLPFFLSSDLFTFYESFNKEHGLIMSFLKFAILATIGEVIGLRIKTGQYNTPGFGILPRALVWGFLGITIKLAFTVFTTGTIQFISFMGMPDPAAVYAGDLSAGKVFIALCISVFMNTIYAPVMMTTHKITDTHILNTGGTIKGLFSKMDVTDTLKNLNWDVQWNFVFKKTIPFFWYPAHTITFLLPGEYQVLFAALLGIALGLILAVASLKTSHSKTAKSLA